MKVSCFESYSATFRAIHHCHMITVLYLTSVSWNHRKRVWTSQWDSLVWIKAKYINPSVTKISHCQECTEQNASTNANTFSLISGTLSPFLSLSDPACCPVLLETSGSVFSSLSTLAPERSQHHKWHAPSDSRLPSARHRSLASSLLTVCLGIWARKFYSIDHARYQHTIIWVNHVEQWQIHLGLRN